MINPKDCVKFFQYFIQLYHDELKKGNLLEANHCATAVLLELENMNQIDLYEYCDEILDLKNTIPKIKEESQV